MIKHATKIKAYFGWFEMTKGSQVASGHYMTNQGCCIFYRDDKGTEIYFAYEGSRYSLAYNDCMTPHSIKMACTRLMGDVLLGKFKAV